MLDLLPGGATSDVESIARSHFSPAERAEVLAAPEKERMRVFLRVWTLKEAVLKCTGDGLAGGPDRLETTLDPPGVAGEAVAEMTGAPLVHHEIWGLPGRTYALSVVAVPRATPQAGSTDSGARQTRRRLSWATTRSQR